MIDMTEKTKRGISYLIQKEVRIARHDWKMSLVQVEHAREKLLAQYPQESENEIEQRVKGLSIYGVHMTNTRHLEEAALIQNDWERELMKGRVPCLTGR